MAPSKRDVRSLVGALFAVNAGLERARRQRKGASTLSLLQVIGGKHGIRPSEIADFQQVHPSLVTRQIRDLEDAGLVDVAADPADRRSCLVTLLPAGLEELRRLEQFGLTRFEQIVRDWKPEEVRTLSEMLQRLRASMATLTAQEERRPVGRRWQRVE
ncbi:MAG TPA: MarR family transcriptional regulator [Acidimicrobiales bacterium]|nr:MarR family transcriptional regulator [Acidimicrobiales bacterium]